MRQRKKVVYKPKEYWKNAIGFDIKKEFLIYQFLCGKLRWAREVKKIDEEKRFTEYKSWRKYVEGNLTECDTDRLMEFYHFLKLREIECNIDIGMDTSLWLPVMVTLFAGIMVQCILMMSEAGTSIDFGFIQELMQKGLSGILWACIGLIVILFFIVIILAFVTLMPLVLLYTVVKPHIKSKYMIAFWRDYLEITEAVMAEKNKQKTENAQLEG